ncbi:MAG TPA: MBL fold metallo-hydrolase [Candidatus Paceibacterota bacterium]|nr:MBL fold metallo-hydrolase [Candidatus Paceibacterota bacterium]
MILTYQGGGCYKAQHGQVVIAVNPPSKDSKRFKISKFGADVVLSSLKHPDWNGVEQATHGSTVPFEISGPGEYEYKEIFIRGLPSYSSYDSGKEAKKRINTIYSFTLDGINICILGALSDKELPAETNEAIEEVDLLIVPVDSAGADALSPKDAYSLAVALEAKAIVPCALGEKGSLEAFLKEAGAKDPQKTDKLTIKKKDLEGKESQVIVISQS